MKEPFVFKKVIYLVEATGRRATTLDDLLRMLTVAEPHAIGYHMHREFLAYKFAHTEWPNDFAYWSARVLGDDVLGERLANIRVFAYSSLADVRAELARIVADHTLRFPDLARVRAPVGREFALCTARKFVLGTGRTAADLSQLAAAIADVEASSLYYHLFESRYDGREAEKPNDFASWARTSLAREDLAHKLSSFDPYMFSMEQVRAVLMRVLSEEKA